IPLRQGRDFADSDTSTSARAAIIDQTFADRHLKGVDPLGHQIADLDDPKGSYTIVGVAQNSRYTSVRETERPMAFVPYAQALGVAERQYDLHRQGDHRMLLREATRIVHDVDPNLPLDKPATQQEQFAETVSQERLIANLSIFFGGLAAFLVAIGLYGTISY